MPELRADQFQLPALDQPALTEIGVVLSGLAVDRLLAALGLVEDGESPTAVVLRMDLLRHAGGAAWTDAVTEGTRRWRAIRSSLDEADPAPSASASIRQAWQRAWHTVLRAEPAPDRDARRVVLAACRLRHAEVDATVDRATIGGTP